jgi:hypothetical protein
MLCSDASIPHSSFPKVTGRCEPDRSTVGVRHRPRLLRIRAQPPA